MAPRRGAWRHRRDRPPPCQAQPRPVESPRHRCGDADVTRDPHPQARAFDLDLGETGFVKQQCKFANKRAVAAFEFCGGCVVRLARHVLDPKLSVW